MEPAVVARRTGSKRAQDMAAAARTEAAAQKIELRTLAARLAHASPRRVTAVLVDAELGTVHVPSPPRGQERRRVAFASGVGGSPAAKRARHASAAPDTEGSPSASRDAAAPHLASFVRAPHLALLPRLLALAPSAATTDVGAFFAIDSTGEVIGTSASALHAWPRTAAAAAISSGAPRLTVSSAAYAAGCRAPRDVHVVLGDDDTVMVVVTTVPRVMWTYWEGPRHPLVERALATWAHGLPHDWTLVRLSPSAPMVSEIVEARPAIAAAARALGPAKFANFLRVELLWRHGGVWMDTSVLLHDPAYLRGWLEAAEANPHLEVAATSLGVNEPSPHYPNIDNWLLAAPRGSPFMREWADEYAAMLMLGAETYSIALVHALAECLKAGGAASAPPSPPLQLAGGAPHTAPKPRGTELLHEAIRTVGQDLGADPPSPPALPPPLPLGLTLHGGYGVRASVAWLLRAHNLHLMHYVCAQVVIARRASRPRAYMHVVDATEAPHGLHAHRVHGWDTDAILADARLERFPIVKLRQKERDAYDARASAVADAAAASSNSGVTTPALYETDAFGDAPPLS